LTAGQRHDSPQAAALIKGFEPQVLIADKGYDSGALIEVLALQGIEAVIPPKKNRLEQQEYDQHLYRERHLIECFIGKLKHYRRVFSRFEKLSKNYLGFLSFVSALICYAEMSTQPRGCLKSLKIINSADATQSIYQRLD
jgi:transposase